MKAKKTLIEIIFEYKQLIIVAASILVLVGFIALNMMPRDEFPEFKIRKGLVIGIYPGATSHQVEEQLTKDVEEYLFQYEEVDKEKTHSISKQNVMVIYVEVKRDIDNPKPFWLKLRHGLNELKRKLPSGVISLTADDDFGETSALLLGIESETKTYKELERYVEKFEDGIRKISATSRVKRFGLQNEEINVYMDDAKLTYYGIKPITVFLALKPQGTVNFSGQLDDEKTIRPIHIPSSYKTESDIANQIIYSDPSGKVVRVKDVAKIVREYPDPDSFIRLNGKKCIIVSLEMQPGNNIVQYGDDVQKVIDKFTEEVPSDVNVGIISDMPSFVSSAIMNFLEEFGLAIFSVILVTMLLLPKRVAMVAASAIPISIFITLGIMWASGISLQTVSLAGLIIVLGMVVDNAIVIIDNYVEKLDHGISPWEAASQSVTDLFGSVFSATLIIVICFLPMPIFMSGTAGDFIKSLPATIGFALFISLIVSVLLIPMLSYLFIKQGIKGNESKKKKSGFLDKLQLFYDAILEKSFTKKKTVVIVGIISFAVGLYLLSITPQQPFPPFERNQFAVEVYLPVGSSLKQTDLAIKEIETKLKNDERVEEVAAFIGTSSPRFNTLYEPNIPAKHYGQLLVITKSSEATLEILDEYTKKYSDHNPNAHFRWKQLNMMNAKAPIEVRVSGDSISTIKQVAEQIENILHHVEGSVWVRTNYETPLQTVEMKLKEDEVARLGYSKLILDYSLMVGTNGFPVSTIWEDDYPVNVNLKVDKKIKANIDEVLDQYVTSQFLVSSVQVRQLVNAKAGWTEGEIARRNGVRTITVRADVERGRFVANVFEDAKPLIDALELPKGVSITYGGDYETGVEEMTPLNYSLAVSITIIFIILLTQFKKMKLALLIMSTIPLSIFGAAFGVSVTGYPFGITAFIGLIGLMGIVVRNGIIYISYAEELRTAHGFTLEEAAISAAKRRMRPIFLTSAAAAVGVIPMIISRSPLWGPLGSVICFGLVFGLALCLIVLPVLYNIVRKSDLNKDESLTV